MTQVKIGKHLKAEKGSSSQNNKEKGKKKRTDIFGKKKNKRKGRICDASEKRKNICRCEKIADRFLNEGKGRSRLILCD